MMEARRGGRVGEFVPGQHLKIGISDIDQWTFSQQLADYWESQGHEVVKSLYHETEFINNCDVVWYDFASVNVVELGKETQKPRAKVIVRAIDIENYMNYCTGFNFDYISHYVFLNEAQKLMVQDKSDFKMPEERIRVIHPGVDMDRYTLKQNQTRGKNAVFLGRLWIGKNVAGAMDVVYELNKIDPGWKLFIRGDRYDPPWWQQYCRYRADAMGLDYVYENRVDDVNAYLEDKDLMIVPSFKEAFSYAACEALAKGIPTVINNWYGVDTVWPKELIYNTPSEAAEKIVTLLHKSPDWFRSKAYNQQDMFDAIDKIIYDN